MDKYITKSWEQDMLKIISRISSRRDSEPFREPVQWEALGFNTL